MLLDCVEGGASVSFMWPLEREKAVAFWQAALESADRGERIVLLAERTEASEVNAGPGRVVGTVQVVLNVPENQPHRAEIAKMLVHRSARRQGLGAALMRAAEESALCRGSDPARPRHRHRRRRRTSVHAAGVAARGRDPELRPLAARGILRHDPVLPLARLSDWQRRRPHAEAPRSHLAAFGPGTR